MRLISAVLLSLCVAAPSIASAQTTRRAASPAVTTTLSITVTDGKGAPIAGVAVRATGPVDREASTPAGMLRFEGLRSGTYRVRFTHDDFVTLERDINVPAGQRSLDQHVMLSAAEKPPPPPPPEPPKPAPLPPPGKAVTVSIPDFVEQNLITASQPQKVSAVACSGLLQTALWQVREPWDNRQHDGSDAMLYVVGGEGTLRMNDRDLPLQAGRFVSVPRGTAYGLTRRGRNPLIVLASFGGEPCTP
jgi:mannose-6-phosphate isomerase-like protein (cupin superfamily)